MAAGVGADEQHDEVVARLGFGRLLFLVELGVVEGHLDRGALLGQFVQAHAHLVERLAEVLVAGDRPAHAQQVLGRVELDAGLFLVGAVGAVGQRFGAGVVPQGLERILQLRVGHVGAQRHVAMDVDFERSVIA